MAKKCIHQLSHIDAYLVVENVRPDSGLFSHPKERAQRNSNRVKKKVSINNEVQTYADVVKREQSNNKKTNDRNEKQFQQYQEQTKI